MARIRFDFRGGHIDPALLRQAYAAEIRRRPVLNARIDDAGPAGGRQVRWRLRREAPGPETVRMADLSGLAPEAAEETMRLMQTDPFTGYSLRTDPPFFMTLCRLPGCCWRLLVFFHHALADAHGISMVLEELFAAYNRLAAGRGIEPIEEKKHAAYLPLLPDSRRELGRGIISMVGFFAARGIASGFTPATKLIYGRHTFQARTGIVHRSIGPQALSRYLAAAKRGGVSFNILLVAAQARAIERWKKLRGEPCGLISMAVHHNLRAGGSELHELSNKFSPFVIDLHPRHRGDAATLVRTVQQMQERARKGAMAQHMACLLFLLNTPLWRTAPRFWLNLVFNNPRIGDSSLVTNLGKLWAVTKDSPAVTRLGDADITAYYMAGPPTPSIGSYFAYLAYRGSLFVTFNYFDWALPAADARSFTDLFLETLDELATCL